ncbi:unnamed protein product [Onchocerca flexuosa]|uniref:Uncharacterized protein n=1 Tax=Onchocerca flexuosa TaxID=387005 RepID=A0A183I510_9BILA|nr:unnamed protein product [Onchocerca flexuosa]
MFSEKKPATKTRRSDRIISGYTIAKSSFALITATNCRLVLWYSAESRERSELSDDMERNCKRSL